MYVPAVYRERRREVLLAAIRARSFGTLISVAREGIQTSQVPFAVVGSGQRAELVAHLARSNPQWHEIGNGEDVVAAFLVDDAYISPDWYPSKHKTGRAVPTWNYISVEARGPAELVDAPSGVREMVETLTRRHESGRARPWSLGDAPKEYIAQRLRQIVGIRLRPRTLLGAWKLDQERSAADRRGAAQGLREVDGRPGMAKRMLRPSR